MYVPQYMSSFFSLSCIVRKLSRKMMGVDFPIFYFLKNFGYNPKSLCQKKIISYDFAINFIYPIK